MNRTEEYIKNFQDQNNKISGKNVNYRRMYPYSTVITILDEYIKEYKRNDDTKELLSDIISLDSDFSKYLNLETILKEKYFIIKR